MAPCLSHSHMQTELGRAAVWRLLSTRVVSTTRDWGPGQGWSAPLHSAERHRLSFVLDHEVYSGEADPFNTSPQQLPEDHHSSRLCTMDLSRASLPSPARRRAPGTAKHTTKDLLTEIVLPAPMGHGSVTRPQAHGRETYIAAFYSHHPAANLNLVIALPL